MAIVSKAGGGGGGGGGESGRAADPEETPERRTNLPPKTAPVVGRKSEMQAVVEAFGRLQREGKPGRVEIVGPSGVGASTVALELARRAGMNFPGGAWVVNVAMGVDEAYADLAATRGGGPVTDLAAAGRAERERLGAAPRSLLVIDGVTSAAEAEAALPPVLGEDGADVFLVSETVTGLIHDVVEVSPVPPQGARRIVESVFHLREEAEDDDGREPPSVRSTDGLAVTASLAARAAVAYEGVAGPLKVEDTTQAVNRLIPLIARHPVALELMLLATAAHPVYIPIDALFQGIAALREGRGEAPDGEEVGSGVLWLARLGILQPEDEARVSMHPHVQAVARKMTAAPEDLQIARTAFAAGLMAEVDDALRADGGLDVRRAPLHQLRALRDGLEDAELRGAVATSIREVETALGVTAQDG